MKTATITAILSQQNVDFTVTEGKVVAELVTEFYDGFDIDYVDVTHYKLRQFRRGNP